MRVDAVPKIEVIGLSKRFGLGQALLFLNQASLACAVMATVLRAQRYVVNPADHLQASGRIKTRIHVLDYTSTAPLAALDPSLVKIPGRWKA